MLDGIFTDKVTGEQVMVVNEDVNFYELNNSVRIKKEVFEKKYEQQVEVDPTSFFKVKNPTNDPLLNLANQLKSMDSNKLQDNPVSGTRVKYTPPVILSDTSLPNGAVIKQPQSEAPIVLTPEEKREMLEKWRREQPGAQIQSVQERDWDAEDERFLNGDKPITPKVEAPKVDPIQMMFKMFKSNYSVKLNIELDENIPNPTFIAMVQENVEADAVEYYSNLISDKLLKDPSKLKNEIYKQLKGIINKELGIEEEKKEDGHENG